MFRYIKLIAIIYIFNSLVYGSWLNNENIQKYPTKYFLEKLDNIDDNKTIKYIDSYTLADIDGSKNISLSYDGVLWFTPKIVEKKIFNPYGDILAINSENNISKFYTKTPLKEKFYQDIDLNITSSIFQKGDIKENIYLLGGKKVKLNFENNGTIVIEYRMLYNNSFNTRAVGELFYNYDKIATKEQKIDLPLDIYEEKYLKSKKVFSSVKDIIKIDIKKDITTTLYFPPNMIGKLYFQEQLDNNLLFNHKTEKLYNKIENKNHPTIDNNIANSSQYIHSQILKKVQNFYYYKDIWKKSFVDAHKYLRYKTLQPTNSPKNIDIKNGYYITQNLIKDDEQKELSIPTKLKQVYLNNLKSTKLIGYNKKKNSFYYQLPKSNYGHWVKVFIDKNSTDDINLYIDNKLYGVLKIDEQNLSKKNNIQTYLYDNNQTKDILDIGYYKFYISDANSLTISSNSENIPFHSVELAVGKEYSFTQCELINIFLYPLDKRKKILKDAIFSNSPYSNGFYLLQEHILRAKKSFEKNIKKDSLFYKNDLNLAKQLLRDGEFNAFLNITKFFTYKYHSKESFNMLYKYYKSIDNNNSIEILLATYFYYTKDIKYLKMMQKEFYFQSNFDLALLVGVAFDINNKTYKSALKEKHFELANRLKSFLDVENISKDYIWKNINYNIISADKDITLQNQETQKTFSRFLVQESGYLDFNSSGGLVEISVQGLTDKNETQNGWIYIISSQTQYKAPLYKLQKNQNIKLLNQELYTTNIDRYYINLPKTKDNITYRLKIVGEDKLINIKKLDIDFLNRFKDIKQNYIKENSFLKNNNIYNSMDKIIYNFYDFQKNFNKSSGIKAVAECLKKENNPNYKDICSDVLDKFIWKKYNQFTNVPYRVTKKVSNNQNFEIEAKKRKNELYQYKDYSKLLSKKSKLIYKIQKNNPIELKIKRNSLRFYKQDFSMEIFIELNGKISKYYLNDKDEKKIVLNLSKEINTLKIYYTTDDIGTILDIDLEGVSNRTIKEFYQVSNNSYLSFKSGMSDIFMVYQDGKKRYIYPQKTINKTVLIKPTLNNRYSEVQIYKLEYNSKKINQKQKQIKKEKIEKKRYIDIEKTNLFQLDILKDKEIYKYNSCVDYFGLNYTNRKIGSEDFYIDEDNKERFYQLSFDKSCKKDNSYLNMNIFYRKHIYNDEVEVLGGAFDYFYTWDNYFNIDTSFKIKNQIDDASIIQLDSGLNKKIYNYKNSNLIIALKLLARELEYKNSNRYIDKDVFSQYKLEHRYGSGVELRHSYKLYFDTQFLSILGAWNNENFTIDNIYGSFEYRQLWRYFETYLKFNLKEYQKDKNRDENYISKNLYLDILTHKWFKKDMADIYLQLHRDIQTSQNYIKFGIQWYFNNDPLYNNSYVGKFKFKDIKSLKNWEDSYGD